MDDDSRGEPPEASPEKTTLCMHESGIWSWKSVSELESCTTYKSQWKTRHAHFFSDNGKKRKVSKFFFPKHPILEIF
jgi:hypothetical protein